MSEHIKTVFDRYLFEIIFIPVLILIALIVSIALEIPNDDTYIYLVYVKNLLAGNGLTYNGTVVEGYSSPLWMALLSLLGYSGYDPFALSQAASLVFALASVVLTYSCSRRLKLGKELSLLPAFLLALSGDTGVYALSGLETFCFTFFLLLSFFVYRGIKEGSHLKSTLLPIILGTASWVRPEGMLLFVVFLICIIIKQGLLSSERDYPPAIKDAVRFVSIFTITILPLFAVRYLYYGELLPNTYYAKANAGFDNIHLGLDYFKYYLANLSLFKFLIIPLLLYGLVFKWRTFFVEYTFLAVWTLYIIIIGGDNLIGTRVLVPISPVLFILVIHTLNDIFNQISSRGASFFHAVRTPLIMFIGLTMGACLFYTYINHPAYITHTTDMKRWMQTWERVGKYLRDNFSKDTLVAVGPAGSIPYYSGMPTIDMFGLNDPYIAHHGKRDRSLKFGHQAGDGEYVLSRMPDIIVIGYAAGFISQREILNSPILKSDYKKISVKGIDPNFLIYAAKSDGKSKLQHKRYSREEQSRLERLLALPYLTYSTESSPDNISGVVKYNRSSAYDGYNLYYRVPLNEAYLMDMEGRVVHTWRWPQYAKKNAWQAIEMLDNGDLLVACLPCGLLKIDWNSNIIFQNKDLSPHHDIDVLPDRTLLVLNRRFQRYRGEEVAFDEIIHLTENGTPISRWSTFENRKYLKQFHNPSLLDSEEFITEKTKKRYKKFLKEKFGVTKFLKFDYYHANTISALPQTPLGVRDRRFQEGNRLVCFRNVDLLVIIDKDTGKIVWSWGPGNIVLPHMPTMLNNGNILIFDNQGNGGYSRVIELEPVTKKIVWEYKGSPPESFHSKWRGSAQRLPNGNTFILESDRGRAIEVTPGKEIVWEWLNPDMEPNKKRHRSIYRMMRVDRDIVDGLLKTDIDR